MLVIPKIYHSCRIFHSSEVLRVILLLFASLLLAGGCATTKDFSSISALESQDGGIEIILMPLDVELSVLTLGGLLEPRSDWTNAAKEHVLSGIEIEQQNRGSKLLHYQEPESNDPFGERHVELEQLHSAVGKAILQHKYAGMSLPTKKETFDWTLGPEVKTLSQKYAADYALFIYIRDSYSSAGRVLAQIAAAALGFGMAGGQQLGFASLVDLRSGDIVWFNRLFSAVGDLRTEEPAMKTVSLLLEGLPR